MSEKVGTITKGNPTPAITIAGIDSHNFLLRTQDRWLSISRDKEHYGHNGSAYPHIFEHVFIAHIMHQLCSLHTSPTLYIYVHSNLYIP